MSLWNIIEEQINSYINNFSEKYHDISYDKWDSFKYTFETPGLIEIIYLFKSIIEDIAKIIANKLYDENYTLVYEDYNKVYIFNNDKTINNLISWKYNIKLNKLLLRYGIGGRVRYIEVNIDITPFIDWDKHNGYF